jgi:extracellular factor (EF) 3-hydroxypalmitic acid methyl ester biosynthesis protein
MTKANIQQDLSVLSQAKTGLVYLTANDWALIADKAARMSFESGKTIIERGHRVNGVHLLLKGKAAVKLSVQGIPPTLGPGEIFGEMSFLDEGLASASVVASENVETYYLDRPTLQSLFELFPHLASRFYRSLAANLARRLRDVLQATNLPSRGANAGEK